MSSRRSSWRESTPRWRLRAVYGAHIRPHLPSGAKDLVYRVSRRWDLWLITPLVTRARGPKWRRSRVRVGIDITYVCDLRCNNCNRSCTQDPTSDHMTLGQIRHFLEESKERQIRWELIGLLGGEPTCHPQFLEVVELVREYRDGFSPETQIRVVTNGHSERTKKLLCQLPSDIEVVDSAKSSRDQPEFFTFNVAPIDVGGYERADFFNACPVTHLCGIGVTPYGYYPCGVAGAIDRTFGFDLGRKVLPQEDDDMKEEIRRFCALCGRFKGYTGELSRGQLDRAVMSSTWEEAYARSRENRPRISRLPERERRRKG